MSSGSLTSCRRNVSGSVAVLFLIVGFAASGSLSPAADTASNAAAPVKVSEFAPANDLLDQVHLFVERLDTELASRDEFDEARQSRVAKEAHLVEVLGVGLALHDSPNALRNSTPSLASAAHRLANSGADYAAARQAVDTLKKIAASAVDTNVTAKPAASNADWKVKAPLGLLMKEVSIVQATLKRNIQGERFKSEAKQSAAAAATLAVVAQAIIADASAIKDPAQKPKWQVECVEMRDAAGAVNKAIHAADLEATKKSLLRLSHSCEACHSDFRKSH